jgi:hypothetical protein
MISLSSTVICSVGSYLDESIAEVILVLRFSMYSNERLLFAISWSSFAFPSMILELAMWSSYCFDSDWAGILAFIDLFVSYFIIYAHFFYLYVIYYSVKLPNGTISGSLVGFFAVK